MADNPPSTSTEPGNVGTAAGVRSSGNPGTFNPQAPGAPGSINLAETIEPGGGGPNLVYLSIDVIGPAKTILRLEINGKLVGEVRLLGEQLGPLVTFMVPGGGSYKITKVEGSNVLLTVSYQRC